MITVLRDAWLNGSITVSDAHRAALNYECPGPLKSSEPINLLIAVVIEVEEDAHQLDLITDVVDALVFQRHGRVERWVDA